MKKNTLIVIIITVVLIVLFFYGYLKHNNHDKIPNFIDPDNICTDSMKINALVDAALNLPDFQKQLNYQINCKSGLSIHNYTDVDLEIAIKNFKEKHPPSNESRVLDYYEHQNIETSIGIGKVEFRGDTAVVWFGWGPDDPILSRKSGGGIEALFILDSCQWKLINSTLSVY